MQWQLQQLGAHPLPESWTIIRLLQCERLVSKQLYQLRGTSFRALVAQRLYQVHQLDWRAVIDALLQDSR
jgi:hypothetical protein